MKTGKNKYTAELESKSKEVIVEALLSPYSYIFYNEWRLDQYKSDYNVVFDQSLEGKIDIQTLNKAIKRFINDHIIFNSHIADRNGTLYWVKNHQIYELEYFKDQLSDIDILKYILKPFDLEGGPLYRFGLIKTSNNKFRFIIVLHHIIIGGNAFNYFCNELSNYYNDQCYKSNVISINEQLAKISNLSEYLAKYVESIKDQSKSFWKKKLLDVERVDSTFLKLNNNTINLLAPSNRNSMLSIQELGGIGEIKFSFGKKILSKLNNLKDKYKITPYIFGQIIYAVLLHKYSGQNKFCISYSTVITEGMDFIYGATVNTNIFTFDFGNATNMFDVITQAKEFIISLKENDVIHTYLPIYDIASASNAHLLTFEFVQTNLKNKPLNFKDIKVTINNSDISLSNDFIVEYEISNEEINYIVRYRLDKVSTVLINEFISTYERLYIEILDELTGLKDKSKINYVRNYELLSQEQYKKTISTWNNTEKDYPSEMTIHQMFQEQVERTPDSIAVVFENSQITYNQLNKRANQLAHYLTREGVGPEIFVVIGADRSIEMVIGILGVLKAGGTYVPLDPSHPQERLEYILDNCGTNIILTQAYLKEKYNRYDKKVIEVDKWNLLKKEREDNLVSDATSSNLAYIIYTSGTTGKPKGVMIEHKQKLNHLCITKDKFALSTQDVIAQTASQCFDISVWQFLSPLIVGARVCIFSTELIQNPSSFLQSLVNNSVTVLQLVPTILNALLDTTLSHNSNFTQLRLVIPTGEAVSSFLCKKWFSIFDIPLINAYGPAECSDDVTLYNLSQNNINEHTTIPIGKALQNTQLYLLDQHMQPLPVGIVGEIYIGGAGVARGYLNRPELTSKKFIANPFASKEDVRSKKNLRLYRTGDLGVYLSDGNLQYIGRNDFQVKIRGYRIELEEIENTLNLFTDVKQSVVVIKEHLSLEGSTDNKYLVGYYIADYKLDEEAILSYLSSKLPEYMVPRVLVHLERLPLTVNGKLDRTSLPEPDFTNNDSYIAPRDELETQVCRIWAEVLNLDIDKVSIRDDFFRLGGDSIVSILLVSRLRQRLGINLAVKDVFNYRTIERIYDEVLHTAISSNKFDIKNEQGMLTGRVSLLPIQQHFFESNFARPNHWNQAFIVKVPDLNLDWLQLCVTKLIEHHDAFRLRYKKNNDSTMVTTDENNSSYIQYYDNNCKQEAIKTLDIRTLKAKEGSKKFETALQETLTEWQSNFNIEDGPIYTIGYIYGYLDGSARIYFALHHLIVDSVSWRILAEDLRDIYNGKDLGVKGSSYRQWVETVKYYPSTHKEEESYWINILADYDSSNQLTKLMVSEDTANHAYLKLTKKQTQLLLKESNRTYNTQVNDLLLTALSYTLFELTGNKVNHIILEGHGREDIDGSIDISRTIGWFTTMFPVRLEIDEEIGNSIKHIKENLRQVPNKGVGYGPMIGYKRSIPRISFNYLGQFDQEDINDREISNNNSKIKGFWNIVDEGIGISIHPYNQGYNIIDINGLMIDGELQFSIASKLNESTTSKLADNLKQKLKEIITYCCNKKQTEYTPSDFTNVESEGDLSGLPLIIGLNQYDWFEMTEIQKAYLVGRLGEYEIGNVANHIYEEYYYKTLDVNKLENVINLLIERYEVLRSIFSFEKIKQKFLSIEEINKYKIHINDYTQLNLNDTDLKSLRNHLSHKVYNPEQFPLFTFEVTKFRDYSVLHISMDLILLDAQSRELLHNIINNLYREGVFGIEVPSITFKDYQDYYQLLKHSNWYSKNKAYWESKIPNMPLRPELPFKISPEKIEYPIFTDHTLYIEKDVWAKFKSQANKYNVSYSAALLGLYGSIISYFSGYKEFLITMTLFNRYAVHDEVQNILGDFTSTNLFHYVDYSSKLVENLKRTHNLMWDDINNALYTGLEVQREIARFNKLANNKAISPIVFTGMIGNKPETIEDNKYLEDNELIDKRYWCGQTSQAWIDLQAIEEGDRLMSKWLYVDQLFENDYIQNLNKLYCDLIRFLADNEWEDTVGLFCLPLKDKVMIDSCNNSEQELSLDTLFSRFEYIVEKNSLQNNIAVIEATFPTGSEKEYRYEQLLQEVESLAKYLLVTTKVSDNVNKAIKFDETEQLYLPNQAKLIGVLAEKGYNQVISTLSIMKSGHGYLPLNIDWPVGRLDEVLEQGNVTSLLLSKTQHEQEQIREHLSKKYNLLIIEDILLEISTNKQLQSQLTKELLPVVSPDDIAYVIFTSGSTGIPKGVTISHRGALNTIDAINTNLNLTNRDKILALSDLSFDLSVYDIFGILSVGGSIVFPKQDSIKEPTHWVELITKYQITIWNTVPQLAGLLVDEAARSKSKALTTYNNRHTNTLTIESLRLFLLSGDWIPITLPNLIKEKCPNAIVMSLGGATEASIWSIWYKIDHVIQEWNSIPYGIAMPNQKMYILNHHNEHCPLEVVGEIHIGGMGVALNYWKDEYLTKKSFIYHKTFGRLYKTGDLGRWHKDGYIEFIGRKDNQVKLNGYRVELEEISAKLLKLEGVEKAIIRIQKEENGDYIIGYLLPHDYNQKIKEDEGNIKHYKEQSIVNKLTHETDKEVFKLAQSGIIKDLEASYNLRHTINLDEEKYRLRKSYRNFLDENIDYNEVIIVTNKIIADLWQHHVIKEHAINQTLETTINNKQLLSNILSTISGIQLETRALPKYRYPSGGSSYAVRCFINIQNQSNQLEGNLAKQKELEHLKQSGPGDEIDSGYYYYNPIKCTLCKFENTNKMTYSQNSSYYELDLVVNWPSIKPLYGEHSQNLAYIEVGHMVSLLTEELNKNNIIYRLEILGEKLDKDNTLAAKLILGERNTIDLSKPAFRINYLINDNLGQCYKEIDSNKYFDLKKQSIFMRASSFGQLLNNGKMLLTTVGDSSIENLILSGLVFQKIGDALYHKDIGSCMLGFEPYEGVIYSMVLGKINEISKQKTEINPLPPIPLEQVINQELAHLLPKYMLPYDYIVLDSLPLSSNGKLEVNKLPLLDIQKQIRYIAPRNELEHKICKIWATILNVPESDISINSNFFRLGGNSLTAIKLASLAKNSGIVLEVRNIFENTTILEQANFVHSQNNSTTSISIIKNDIISNFSKKRIIYEGYYQETKNILLTGATGFLGRYILIDLLENTNADIYCIVRTENNITAQQKLSNILSSFYNKQYNSLRVIVVEGDLSKPDLGLSQETRENLENNIDQIYHCGAYVHHLHNYETLRSHNVLSTLELIKLSVSKKIKKLNYISTVFVDSLFTLFNNEIEYDNIALPNNSSGYIETKLVCEKIIESYIKNGYPMYIYRPGNITGHSKTGFCISENNHSLLLLKGFIQQQIAPKWNDLFEMTPVDSVSKAIVKLSLNTHIISKRVFNLHNPNTISWEAYIKKVNNIGNFKIKFVDSEHWRLNILPSINSENAMFIIKNLYTYKNIQSNDDSLRFNLIRDQDTECALQKLQVIYPKRYDKLLRLYCTYLQKIKFI